MAGGFYGVGIGNIGAFSGANFDPYLKMRQMQLEASQFDRELEDRRKARAGGENFDMIQFEAAQRQAELDRAAKERQFAGQMEIERGGLGLRGQELTANAASDAAARGLKSRELDQADTERAGLDARYKEAKTDAATKDADAKAEKERLTAEAKGREDAVKGAIAWVEKYTGNVDASDMGRVGRVAQNAKMNAQKLFANDPDALLAALDRANAWEDEQATRASKERKAKLEETELENTQLARKLTLEDREEARADKSKSEEEDRKRKRDEADARVLSRAYEGMMDRAMELEKQAMAAEGEGSVELADSLRKQADDLSAKADKMGQKLGFFDAE